MSPTAAAISAALADRARAQPDDVAYTFVDYEYDPADEDLDGLDLRGVVVMINGAERVHGGPPSLPLTTSGKVRRAMCVEVYRTGGFRRLDAIV